MNLLRNITLAAISNSVTYIGILFFEWNIYQLFFCYWLEMIMIIGITRLHLNLDQLADHKSHSAFKISMLDLWWLFWILLHLLFMFVFLKDAMKAVLILPEDVLTASNFFFYIVGYSFLLPAVFFSSITTLCIHLINLQLDKRQIKGGILKGYNTTLLSALPFIYLISNHLLIFVAGSYHQNSSAYLGSFPLMITLIKTATDSLLFHIKQSKKIYIDHKTA